MSDPDTPTADAPADTDPGWRTGAYDVKPPHASLGEWALSLADECDEAEDPETAEVLRRLVHDADETRAQVEAARQDTRDAVTVITRLTDIALDGQVSLNDVVEALDRAARGD